MVPGGYSPIRLPELTRVAIRYKRELQAETARWPDWGYGREEVVTRIISNLKIVTTPKGYGRILGYLSKRGGVVVWSRGGGG